MKLPPLLSFLILALLCLSLGNTVGRAQETAPLLEAGFADPPPEAKLRAYWWWLNGNVTKEAITTDLEGMKAQGFGGAILCDADGSNQDGNARVPHGPTFFTPAWRELYKHALREADRLGLEMSLNIQSGWNLGGPMIRAEDAPKKLVWSSLVAPSNDAILTLPEPKHPPAFYRDVAVLAFPNPAGHSGGVKNLPYKALQKTIGWSAPDTHVLFEDDPATPEDENIPPEDVLDLTTHLHADGTFDWSPPGPGRWLVMRFGCTLNDHCRVSTNSEGWDGYALDPYDAAPFRAYWDAVVEPLIADAGPLAGKTLRYLTTDSWEVETTNWTPPLREEFRRRRGYDLLPYLPVIAGQIMGTREISNRFLEDLRRTMGDLAVDNHYRPFLELAHQHGLEIHPESGGPHSSPFDAQQLLGMTDAPMSEFWAKSPRHRTADADRFFVKQPASAAHTNGKKLVLAEGFTNIGLHWQESVADNLKPTFDQAICEGLNRLVWHDFVCSPAETGIPGQQYFAGTYFNPKTTWFARSGAFLKYINRCQFMMQRGLPVADVLYYYGDHVPNFAQLRASDPAKVGPGYDYDVASADVLLHRASVENGRIVLPDGVSYALLALPDYPAISLPVLRKVRELVLAGAVVTGPRPKRASGLTAQAASDEEVRRIADELWGQEEEAVAKAGRMVEKGRVFTGQAAGQVLSELHVPGDPDLLQGETLGGRTAEPTRPKFVHRREDDTDIYFVSNPTASNSVGNLVLRAARQSVERWDPVSGTITRLRTVRRTDGVEPFGVTPPAQRGPYPPVWIGDDGSASLRLEVAPNESFFLVVRDQPSLTAAPAPLRALKLKPVLDLGTNWTVRFDPQWGGPATADFPLLVDWTARPETGIRFYSGTATYVRDFDCPAYGEGIARRYYLDLGEMHELADVRLNGQSLGNVWAKPFRVEITGAVRATGNHLEIEVTNFWANRVIGDAALPEAQRLTRTNIRRLTSKTPLSPSGLLGPVQILTEVTLPKGIE